MPDQAHCLLERPSRAPLPLDVAGAEMAPHGLSLGAVEQMPGGDEIQRGVGRPEAAAVKHADKMLALHEEIRGNEVLVGS